MTLSWHSAQCFPYPPAANASPNPWGQGVCVEPAKHGEHCGDLGVDNCIHDGYAPYRTYPQVCIGHVCVDRTTERGSCSSGEGVDGYQTSNCPTGLSCINGVCHR